MFHGFRTAVRPPPFLPWSGPKGGTPARDLRVNPDTPGNIHAPRGFFPHNTPPEETPMSAPENLTDVYTDELKDLWSANDQMTKAVTTLAGKASDAKLKDMLDKSQGGIAKHTDILKELIAGQDEKVAKEHCKGMEGLVEEATKHVLEEGPKKGPLLDALIIAQYQRMTHYGIAGFGTAAAYAEALGLKDDAKKLNDATKEIYGGDEYMTQLAETSVNLQAEDA